MKSSIMNLLLSTSFLCLTASAAEPDQSPSNILRRSTIELQKRCVGDCVSCFGDGYTECPGSSYYCYKPGDTYYGLESCSSTGSGSSDSGSSASAAPTSDSSPSSSGSGGFNYSIPEFCSSGGGDCKTCFGSTYVKCPNDDFWCYDPNNSTTTCPSDDNGGGGSSAGSGSSVSGSSSIYSSASAASSFDTSTYTTSAANGGETTNAPVIGGGAGSSDTSSDDFGFGSQTSTSFAGSTVSASGSSGGASQTFASSAGSGEATDAPASATTNGQGSLREGMVGMLFAGIVCFAAGWVGVGAGL